ncbi:MAG: hypothetical protein HY058_16845 [Proteobacteria bacterium]|nr:hypothetical protein [Pseudomonadota bacterium]
MRFSAVRRLVAIWGSDKRDNHRHRYCPGAEPEKPRRDDLLCTDRMIDWFEEMLHGFLRMAIYPEDAAEPISPL